jgi:hypothetical protein
MFLAEQMTSAYHTKRNKKTKNKVPYRGRFKICNRYIYKELGNIWFKKRYNGHVCKRHTVQGTVPEFQNNNKIEKTTKFSVLDR